MSKLKTIIIDDMKPVREELKLLLDDFREIEVIGEAGDIDGAVQLINAHNPDVIFLDIQLKNESGFDLLNKANITSKIIFVTAYDQYAIRAFEVNALDYLLKPIKKDRLSKAIQRIQPAEDQSTSSITQNHATYDDVIYLMINGSLKFIKVKLLKCIVAEGKYSFIVYGNSKKELVSKTLHEWEKILPEKYFVRIHRSTIVNFEYVLKVKKCKNYTHEVYLKDIEESFMMSRRYAAKLKDKLSW